MSYTTAQKKAYAIKMAKKRRNMKQIAPGIFSGDGAYYDRMNAQMRGQGDYKSFFRKMFRGANKVAAYIPVPENKGSQLGKAIGGALGAEDLGRVVGGAGQMALKALGMGDYKVQSNSLLDAQGIPKVTAFGRSSNSVRVQQKEYLGDVFTSTDGSFKNTSYPINPGLAQTFPWLSLMAAGFEEYRINGMILEFKSTSAFALSSTNTALGTCIMATEYDSSKPAFVNKQQMENHEFANSNSQAGSMLHAIECKRRQSVLSELYVRTGAIPANDDERIYDFGIFQIATVGQQANVAVDIGELWISYDITFYKKQLVGALGLELASDKFKNTAGVSNTAFFGTGAGLTAVTGSNLGCTLNATTIAFPSWVSEGTYHIVYFVVGTSATVSSPTTTATNCSLLTVWDNDTSTIQTNTGEASPVYIAEWLLKITGQNATFALSSGSGTLPSSITYMDLIVNQINGAIGT